jgi:hypothetical protein
LICECHCLLISVSFHPLLLLLLHVVFVVVLLLLHEALGPKSCYGSSGFVLLTSNASSTVSYSLNLTVHHFSGNYILITRFTWFYQFFLYLLAVSFKYSTYSSFLISSFLILSRLVFQITNFKNLISAVCNLLLYPDIMTHVSQPYNPLIVTGLQNFICVSILVLISGYCDTHAVRSLKFVICIYFTQLCYVTFKKTKLIYFCYHLIF